MGAVRQTRGWTAGAVPDFLSQPKCINHDQTETSLASQPGYCLLNKDKSGNRQLHIKDKNRSAEHIDTRQNEVADRRNSPSSPDSQLVLRLEVENLAGYHPLAERGRGFVSARGHVSDQ